MRRPALAHVAVAGLIACAACSVTSRAHADEAKRPPQDYGSAPEADSDDPRTPPAAWPARVVLFPLWFVTEFILRRPLGWLVQHAEKGRWVETFEDFFTVGGSGEPLGQLEIYPSALFDVGLEASVGLNLKWRYFGSDANTVELHAGTWGPDWINLHASDTYALSKNESVFVESAFARNRDNPYSGIGPFTRQDARTRFASTTFDVAVGHERAFSTTSALRSRIGFRTLLFGDRGCCSEPALEDEVAAGRMAAPGFGQGYRAGFQRLDLDLDSRPPRPARGTGARLKLHEEGVFTLDPLPGEERRSWVKYGGSLQGALDLTGEQRVVSLAVSAELADPLVGTIPFTDLVTLGGDSRMPGFLRGRLVDRSATVARLQYTWPIWVYLDGVAHASVGNVWGAHFDGFDVRSTRLSTGLGIRSSGEKKSGFELLFAVGSEPFDDSFRVDSFRLVVGSHHGF